MILAHAIIGITLGNYFGHFWYFLIGSIIPDFDHLFIIFKGKIFSFKDILNSIRFEKVYNLNYKTKYIHSVLGALVISAPVAIINIKGSLFFFIGYIIHLLLDWLDIDDKYYLYPFKKKFSGLLPIFSMTEIIFTVILFLLMLTSFKMAYNIR